MRIPKLYNVRKAALAAAPGTAPSGEYALRLPKILPLLGERAGVRASVFSNFIVTAES
jgi:hypothetical protein